MRNLLFRQKLLLIFSFIVTAFISSCANLREVKYLQDINSLESEVSVAEFKDPIINSDDILVVTVNTIDPQAGQVINNGNSATPGNAITIATSGNQQQITGYLVDREGNIELPVLGKIKISGLTTLQAREAIRQAAVKFYNSPAVNVRFANFKVTVLGEVTRPASYVVPSEKVSVLDALGYAGDLTIYGKRQNVLLLRKNETGKTLAVKLDLTKKELLKSPYFYLRQNDVIYVEPSKAKVQNSDSTFFRYAGLGISLVSLWVILINQTSLGN
ncbi:MAG: Soluble ligand binding domain [Sphingobacteriales bacterium]|nr:Soluble ligand binding domain [Sphingobacteriales bacterium]